MRNRFEGWLAYWKRYGPVSIEHLGGECGPNFLNSNFAWFWYSSTLLPDWKYKWMNYFCRLRLGECACTCSSSCIVPTSGRPSTTRAIIVIKAILIDLASIQVEPKRKIATDNWLNSFSSLLGPAVFTIQCIFPVFCNQMKWETFADRKTHVTYLFVRNQHQKHLHVIYLSKQKRKQRHIHHRRRAIFTTDWIWFRFAGFGSVAKLLLQTVRRTEGERVSD